MAHEIDQSTGRAAMFAAGTPPWHGLGINVEEAQDSQNAIRLAGLDWDVVQWPVNAISPDGWGTVTAKGFVANVRFDTHAVLGVVSNKYQPFQNNQAFAFADAIVGEGHAHYETAGALRGGRRVWMMLKLPEEIRAGREDRIDPYLLLFNSHDGSSCLRALLTSVRVVCANTLRLALSNAGNDGITIRHRGDLQSRVEEARVTLGLVHKRLNQFSREVDIFRSVPMGNGRLSRYFDSLLPPLSKEASGRGAFRAESVIRPLIAENLALDRPWYADFSRLMTRVNPATNKPYRDQLQFERKELHDMMNDKNMWDEEGEALMVKAIHEGIRQTLGRIREETDGASGRPLSQATKNRWERFRDKLRLDLAGAKTESHVRFVLTDLFSRGGSNSVLREHWSKVLPVIRRDWHLARDLGLLALASYVGKGEPKEDSVGNQ